MSGNLIDNPNAAWVTNGVNAVLQTDLVEGLASGASHGGVGNSNACAQVLANRTALLYGQQQTDKANIGVLQGQVGTLFGLVGIHGLVVFGPGSWSWTVPSDIVRALFIATGGGGGGSNCQAQNIGGDASGGGGGAGGTAFTSVPVSAGQVWSGVTGAGGASQANGGNTTAYLGGGLYAEGYGGAGSSFVTSQTAPGGNGGTGYAYEDGYVLPGGYGSDGQAGNYAFTGNGAASFWGGGGRAGAGGGCAGEAWGSGGGGAYDLTFSNLTRYGGAGAPGVVFILY